MADVRLERQLSYYFSDKNLWKDVWLVNQLGDDCTGFIAAEVIAGFNRVQQITSELDLVVASLQRINELEVKEDSQGASGPLL
jgi:la-related protein 1